jgi:hypothetical protein
LVDGDFDRLLIGGVEVINTNRVLRGLTAVPYNVSTVGTSTVTPHDNFLYYADKRYTVTVNEDPTTGNISNAFNTTMDSQVKWNNTVNFPVTIEINFGGVVHYWNTFGLNFVYSRYAQNVKIEVYRTDISSWETLLDVTGNTSHQIYVKASRNWVQKIKYTISGINPTQTEISVTHLYAMNSQYSGQGWVDRGGDTIFGQLKINTVMPSLEVDPDDPIETDEVRDMLFDNDYNDPDVNEGVTGILKFYDPNQTSYTSLFGITIGGVAPALCTTHHLIVRKDFTTRGMLKSYEGVVVLHGDERNRTWGESPYYPMILLAEGGYYGDMDTLEIRKVDNVTGSFPNQNIDYGWGDLACGNIDCAGVIHGGGNNGDAFRVGDDIYLRDINVENAVSFQGAQNRYNARLYLGSGNDVYIERGGYNTLYVYRNINPGAGTETGYLGEGGRYWYGVVSKYVYYKYLYQFYDEYDDLSIAKLWGEKNQTLPEDYDRTKLKPPTDDPFKILKGNNEEADTEEFFDAGKVSSFLMGCVKTLAKKQDEHDSLLLKLLNEVESLRDKIAS